LLWGNYYLHVDLAYKHDRAAVAMASVHEWVTIKYSDTIKHRAPVISVDAVRFWTPRPDQNIDIEDVKNFIVELKMAGFPIKLVTFDRWNSVAYRQQLQSDFGMKTDILSVAKQHYEDFALAISEQRVRGYSLPLLVDELLGLRVIKGNKVDHQRKGSKDLSDAVVGAIYNVINNEKRDSEIEIEVYFSSPENEREPYVPEPQPVIKPKMPKNLSSFINSRSDTVRSSKPIVVNSSGTGGELKEIDLNIYMDGEKSA